MCHFQRYKSEMSSMADEEDRREWEEDFTFYTHTYIQTYNFSPRTTTLLLTAELNFKRGTVVTIYIVVHDRQLTTIYMTVGNHDCVRERGVEYFTQIDRDT